MRAEDFLDAMSNIRPEWIEDAENTGKTVPLWLKWCSIAACLLCVVAVGALRLSQGAPAPASSPNALAQPEQFGVSPIPSPTPPAEQPKDHQELEDSAPEEEDSVPAQRQIEPPQPPDAAEAAGAAEAPIADDPMIPTMEDMENGGFLYAFPSSDGVHEIRVWNLYRVPLTDYARWWDAETDLDLSLGNNYPAWDFDLFVFNSLERSGLYQVGMDADYTYLLDINTEILPILDNPQDLETYLNVREACQPMISSFLAENGITENPQWAEAYMDDYSWTSIMNETGYYNPSLGPRLQYDLPTYKCTSTVQNDAGDLFTILDPYTLSKSLPDLAGIGWTVYRQPMTPEELDQEAIPYDIILAQTENYTYFLTRGQDQEYLDDPISKANYYNMMQAGKTTIARFLALNELEPYGEWATLYDELCIPTELENDPEIQKWIYP